MTNKMENINDVTMEKNYTVYMHICPNGKRYIGITRQIPKYRWKNGNGYRYNKHFWNAIQKYEWNNFEHIIIENNLTKEQAENMEIELIAKYRSNESDYGYNIENGGNTIGTHSIETKKKISENSKASKKIHCDNLIFNSITDCANYYSISVKTIINWLKGIKVMRTDFQKFNLRYATNDDLNKYEKYDTNKHGDKANILISGGRSKYIHCDNLIFNSITDCANYYGIKRDNIKVWLNGKNKMRSDFQKLNLRYATNDDLNKCEKYDTNKHGDKANINFNINKTYAKYIHCDNLIFNSITECASYYNVKMVTMSNWLLGKFKMPLDFQQLNLRYATNEDLNTYPHYTPVNN